MRPLKVFDCFPFFNEFEQLRLRIALLEDVVDRFVVMEAHQTHTGKPKPLYLAESGATDLLGHPKLVHRAVDLPVGYSHWEREQYQREAIGSALQALGAAPEDMVLVSDVDEIPTVAAVQRARGELSACTERALFVFEQRMFYFRLNYEMVWSRKLPWLGTAAARVGDAPSVNGMRTTGRYIRGRHAQNFDRGFRPRLLPDAGWHFSYLGGDAALNEKLSAYAHQETSRQDRRGVSVQGIIDRRESLFPRRGLVEVWAVVDRASVGLPEAAVARAGVGGRFEPNADSTAEILRRVRDTAIPLSGRLGRIAFGLSRRSPWPRLP